jgi:hypothetical protein
VGLLCFAQDDKYIVNKYKQATYHFDIICTKPAQIRRFNKMQKKPAQNLHRTSLNGRGEHGIRHGQIGNLSRVWFSSGAATWTTACGIAG